MNGETYIPILLAGIDLAAPYLDWVLMGCLFCMTVLFIIAIFSQPGQIKLSPQREAAIATGHTDRRTVFEKPGLRPVMWLLLVLAHRMATPKTKEWVRRNLVAAGNPNYLTAEEFLAMAILAGVSLAVSLSVFHFVAVGSLSLVAIAAGVGIGMGLSMLQLYLRASDRVRVISKRVPYALDLIGLAMSAGATFTEAVRTVVKEDIEDPFNTELKTVLAEIELGTTRRKAMQNLAERVPLEMLRSIVASVIQAEELGTPLSDVLRSQATLLRMQRSVRAENAAAVASVRILVPSLLILMSVILAVFSPMILRVVRKGLF